MKKILIFLFILINSIAYSQDWCGWAFEYNFELTNKYSYKLDSLNVYINEPFQNSKFSKAKLTYNDSTSNYSILLKYGCVSCGFDGMKNPPTIFLQLFIYNEFYNQKYSVLIPFDFEEQNENQFNFKYGNNDDLKFPTQEEEFNPVQFNIGKINYSKFIENDFKGVRIDKNGKRIDYKTGEIEFPLPNKLLKIE
ncbi:hypothetical protein AAFN75_17880 [Algibacter sp. AS12]|uniref:hypothetical protein n=1 Tax=Algibacter sp. AS12 TaxID=3135773 RepID=UPI00398B0838